MVKQACGALRQQQQQQQQTLLVASRRNSAGPSVQASSVFTYGYEYQGNNGRLVITTAHRPVLHGAGLCTVLWQGKQCFGAGWHRRALPHIPSVACHFAAHPSRRHLSASDHKKLNF